jgi:hypothetical protein
VSLKAFHIFFIVLAILLAAGCAAWGFASGMTLAFNITCAVLALLLTIYGIYFVKKSRKLII